MPEISWDTVIITCFLAGALFGFLVRKGHVITILISSYISFAVAQEMGLSIARFIRVFFTAPTELSHIFYVKIFLFVVIFGLLATETRYIGGQHREIPVGFSNNLEGSVYGFLAAGLLISSFISLMTSSMILSLSEESILVEYLMNLKGIFIITPVLLLCVSSIIGRFKPQ